MIDRRSLLRLIGLSGPAAVAASAGVAPASAAKPAIDVSTLSAITANYGVHTTGGIIPLSGGGPSMIITADRIEWFEGDRLLRSTDWAPISEPDSAVTALDKANS